MNANLREEELGTKSQEVDGFLMENGSLAEGTAERPISSLAQPSELPHPESF